MKATFKTRCAICDVVIEPGEEIEKNMDDEWCHAGCVEDEQEEYA